MMKENNASLDEEKLKEVLEVSCRLSAVLNKAGTNLRDTYLAVGMLITSMEVSAERQIPGFDKLAHRKLLMAYADAAAKYITQTYLPDEDYCDEEEGE